MSERGGDGVLSNMLDMLPPNTEDEDTATFGSKRAERRAVVRVSDLQGELIEIVPHTDNDGIQDGVNLMQSLHDVRVEDGENMSQPHAFEVWYDRGEFRFLLVAANERARDRFQRRISNVYPDAEVNPVDSGEAFPTIYEDDYQVGGWLEENRHTFFPIKQHSKEGFETGDPYADILGEMTTLDDSFVCLQIIFRPAKHDWTRKGPDGARVEDIAEGLRSENVEDLDSLGAWNPMRELQTRDPTKKQKEAAKIVEEQIGRQGFHTNIRVFAASPQQYEAEERVRGTTGMFAKYYNSQVKQGLEPFGLGRDEIDTFYRYLVNREWKDRKMILSIDELAGIAHIPTQEEVDVPGIPWRYSQTGAEAPATSPQHETDTDRTRRQPSSQTDIVGELEDADSPTATDPGEGSLLDDVAEFSHHDTAGDELSDEEIVRQQLPTEKLQTAAEDFVTDVQDSDTLLVNITEDDIRRGAHKYTQGDIGKTESIRAEADERTFFDHVLQIATEEGESLQVGFEHSSAFREATNALDVAGPRPPADTTTQPSAESSTGASGDQSTTQQSGVSNATESPGNEQNRRENQQRGQREENGQYQQNGGNTQNASQIEISLTDPAVEQQAERIIDEYNLEPLSEAEIENLIAEDITKRGETVSQQTIDAVKQAIESRQDGESGLVDTVKETIGWGGNESESESESQSSPKSTNGESESLEDDLSGSNDPEDAGMDATSSENPTPRARFNKDIIAARADGIAEVVEVAEPDGETIRERAREHEMIEGDAAVEAVLDQYRKRHDTSGDFDVETNTFKYDGEDGAESATQPAGSDGFGWVEDSGDTATEGTERHTAEGTAAGETETETVNEGEGEGEPTADSTPTTTRNIVEEALAHNTNSEFADEEVAPNGSDSDSANESESETESNQHEELAIERESDTESDEPPARWETEDSEELEEWETEPNQIVVRRGKDGVPAALSRSGVADTVEELLTTLRRRSGFWTERSVDDPSDITAQDVQEWVAEYVDGSGSQGSQEAQPIERAILSQIEGEADVYILSEDEQAIARQPSGVWCNASIYATDDPYSEDADKDEVSDGGIEPLDGSEDVAQSSDGFPTNAAALLIECNVCEQETTHSRLVLGEYKGWECEDCGATIEDDVAENRYTTDEDEEEEMFGMDKVNVTRKEQLFSEYIRLLIASVPPNHRDKLSPGVQVSTLIEFIRELEKRDELMPLSEGVIENTRPDLLDPSDVVDNEQIKTPADNGIEIADGELTETPLSALGIDPANIQGYSSITENEPSTSTELIGTSTQVNNTLDQKDDVQTEGTEGENNRSSESSAGNGPRPDSAQPASQPQSRSMGQPEDQSESESQDESGANTPDQTRHRGEQETNTASWVDDNVDAQTGAEENGDTTTTDQ